MNPQNTISLQYDFKIVDKEKARGSTLACLIDLKLCYPFTLKVTCVFSQRKTTLPPSTEILKVSTNLSVLPGLTVTRKASSASLYLNAPHWSAVLLKIIVHSFSPGMVKSAYFPFGNSLPSIFTFLSISKVVASLAPLPQPLPNGSLPPTIFSPLLEALRKAT